MSTTTDPIERDGAPPSPAGASSSRRHFLALTGLTAATALATPRLAGAATPTAVTSIGGSDLSGWTSVLGDALYAAPGQAPVAPADIAAEHAGPQSVLAANVARRGVMAHHIAYRRMSDAGVTADAHSCDFEFRMPYLPAPGRWPDNAQTVEGGFFVWDGAATRLDYGVAFQWILNPWMPTFGSLRTWTGSTWSNVATLTPDTAWHALHVAVDVAHRVGSLSIDGQALPTALTTTAKTGWGTDTSARLQAEVISLWPGNAPVAPSHRAEFRNWTWARTSPAGS